MVKTPEGLAFPSKKGGGDYYVGRELGSGAQGSVHAVTDGTGRELVKWAVKVAQHPKQKAGIKKKKSIDEVNIGMLYGEYHLYLSHFRSLREGGGKGGGGASGGNGNGQMIPNLPRDVAGEIPAYGDIACRDGPDYRFLTMERMEGPFFDVIDALVADAAAAAPAGTGKKAASIDLGPINQRMVEILRAFHDCGYVFVDVKPDNFMLAPPTTSSSAATKKRSSSSAALAKQLASRIRWLDLSQVKRARDLNAAAAASATATNGVHGTPLYASIHVHDHTIPSRRDDMFSVGLVLCELAIRLRARLDGSDTDYGGGGGRSPPSYLPWATERSDEDVGNAMREQVLDRSSDFYARLPSSGIADSMHEFLMAAHNLDFKKQPQYDDFAKLVSGMKVAVPPAVGAAARRGGGTAAAAAASKKTAAKKRAPASSGATKPKPKPKAPPRKAAPGKRSRANVGDDDDDEEDGSEGKPVAFTAKPPPSSARRGKPKPKSRAKTDADDSDDDKNEGKPVAFTAKAPPSSSSSARRGKPKKADAKAASPSARRSSRLRTSSPHGGYAEEANDNEEESPPSKKAAKVFHADVDDVVMEDVEDSDDDSDDYVEVVDMDIDDVEELPRKKPAAAAAKKGKAKDDEGIMLSVEEGPDRGKSLVILKPKSGSGKIKDVYVGTKPSCRKTHAAFLLTDKSIGSTHVKISGAFGSQAPSCHVDVTDLQASVPESRGGGGTFVDGKRLDAGAKRVVYRGGLIGLGSKTTIRVSWWTGASDKENCA